MPIDEQGDQTIITPNPGPQEKFLQCEADICIFGGAAGGSKTWALLLDGMRGVGDPNFRDMIFRRTVPNITNSGGLWDEAVNLFGHFDVEMVTSPRHKVIWPSGATTTFTHLVHESTMLDHKGGQYTRVAFDELTEFTEKQFWYLFSRLRSPGSRFRPWARATTNPLFGSWVHRLIEWWIDPDTGYPIPERDGVLRYFVRDDNAFKWVDADYRDEDGDPPISLTFIASKLEDNLALMSSNEGAEYRRMLKTQTAVEKARLKDGNWLAHDRDGIFKNHRIDPQGVMPSEVPEDLRVIRYWDLADTEPHEKNPNPDDTSSAKVALHIGEDGAETLYIFDSTAAHLEGAKKRVMMKRIAEDDGFGVEIHIEEEGGSSGKEVLRDYKTTHLAGFNVSGDRPTGSKTVRAGRWKPLAEEGRVVLVRDNDGRRGEWMDAFLSQLDRFDGTKTNGKKRDRVDAVSGGYAVAKKRKAGSFGFAVSSR